MQYIGLHKFKNLMTMFDYGVKDAFFWFALEMCTEVPHVLGNNPKPQKV